MPRRKTKLSSPADDTHTNGKRVDSFYPPPLPDGLNVSDSPPRRHPHTGLTSTNSFLFISGPPPQPPSPASSLPSLPSLPDELPLLEDGGGGGSPPTCPDCSQPLTVQEEDGVLLLQCSHCLHPRYMSAECLFPPAASHSGLGPLLGRPLAEHDAADSGMLSRTVSNLFGANGRHHSFIPMGDTLAPPSAAPSFASTLSFTAPSNLPHAASPIPTYSPMAMPVYDDSGFSHSFDAASTHPSSRSLSNAFSAFPTANGAAFTNWSAAPHSSYLSDREGAAVRHVTSVSSQPIPTTLRFEADSSTGRLVSRPYTPGTDHSSSSNGLADGELLMEVPRERLSIDRHALTVIPLAATTPFYRMPDALTAPHMPILPFNSAPSTRRSTFTATSPLPPQHQPPPASTSTSSSSTPPPAAVVPSELTAAHYVAISELHIDELCNKLAMRGRLPSICRAALQHVMRQSECTFSATQHMWQKHSLVHDHSATHVSKAKTSHAVALASAVFYYVYQRHAEQHHKKAAAIAIDPKAAANKIAARSLVKLPLLEVARLSTLISSSADSALQHRITTSHLQLYIDAVTPHLAPLDLDAMSGPATATSVLLSRPLHVAACRPSFIEYADKFRLDTDTLVLAIDVLNSAVRLNLSSRRNHTSLSAAALFLACCLQAVRLTQHDFCQQIGLTEVTLRKVNKELGLHWQELVPDGYKAKAVPQFLQKQWSSEAKRKKKEGDSKVAKDEVVVGEDEEAGSDTSGPASPRVKQEPGSDDSAEEQSSTTSGGVQLLMHEPFDPAATLPLDASAVATAVPRRVLTCRHRFSAQPAPRRVQPANRSRSSVLTAVTSDSDTEEEGESHEQQQEEEGHSSSSRHAAVDASSLPAFLPPFVPHFYDVRN